MFHSCMNDTLSFLNNAQEPIIVTQPLGNEGFLSETIPETHSHKGVRRIKFST